MSVVCGGMSGGEDIKEDCECCCENVLDRRRIVLQN